MTMASTTYYSWNNSGVFSFFNFTQAVIKCFTIDTSLTRLEQKEKEALLGTEFVAGKCKTCGWESKVHFGNPSNWVRHLKVTLYSIYLSIQ